MINQFARTEALFGKKAMDTLAKSRVAVFGIGGVGGHAAETLARSGVGTIDLIDSDTFSVTNINRQLYATLETVGKYKVDVAKARIFEINPQAHVRTFKTFYMPETADNFDFTQYDYIIDAIDTVTAKIELVMRAQAANVPIISSMGTGNKLDPTLLEVTDIYKTSVCPLARVMRRELKNRGVKKLKVVYSPEPPVLPDEDSMRRLVQDSSSKKPIPASTAFVPPVAGIIMAGETVKDLIELKAHEHR